MRIIVTGASGNVGTGLLRRLRLVWPAASVEALCRRPPAAHPPYDHVRWVPFDLTDAGARRRLTAMFDGADVVVHLAWAIQPVRDESLMRRMNIDGTAAVLGAVADAGVPHLVVASSLGAYAPGNGAPVDESWPVTGQPSSSYSRHKVMVETMLDEFELSHPSIGVARIRPTVVSQRCAGAHMAALYLGPFVPKALFRVLLAGALTRLPLPAGLTVQLVHADDVGDAIVAIVRRRSTGAFNLAGDILGPGQIAGTFRARPLTLPAAIPRVLLRLAFALHAVAVSPGWYDVATRSPMMDSTRARTELGWQPAHHSEDALTELVTAWAQGTPGCSAALRDEP